MGKPKFKLTKKQVLAIGGVVLLLAAMAGAGWLLWWLQNRNAQLTANNGAFSKATEKTLPVAADEAQNLALSGKTTDATKKIQDALNQPNVSNDDRQKLLIQEGVTYGNNNDHQKALAAFLEAEKVKSDFTTSHLIGEEYEALGNKDKAIEYYKKALTQLDSSAISYQQDKDVYEQKIKDLGGQP